MFTPFFLTSSEKGVFVSVYAHMCIVYVYVRKNDSVREMSVVEGSG